MRNLYAQIKAFLRIHWVGMLFGAIPTIVMAVITLLSIFINFRIDFARMGDTVAADTAAIQTIQAGQDMQNISISKILQSQKDQGKQIDEIHTEINDIHNYFFKK